MHMWGKGWGVRIVRHIVGSFSFLFAIKDVGKTVRYNDTRDANKRVTYCLIHELLLIKALRLMSGENRLLRKSLLIQYGLLNKRRCRHRD